MTALAIILFSLIFLLLVFAIAWAFLVAPARRDPRMDKFIKTKYAHRGLHGEGVCENSMTAFARAAEAGYGIELDVRLSSDGELVVFHDDTLLRVAGIDKKVAELTREELSRVHIGGTDDCVPTLREVLELVDGRVPLLIEIKMGIGEDAVVFKFLEVIESYRGEYIVESFNPSALKIIREKRPDILVGFLSMEYSKTETFRGKKVYRCLELLLSDFMYRPNFIAYDKAGAGKLTLKAMKKLFSANLVAWTVKSAEEEENIKNVFDTVIFEGYLPEK